MSAPPSGTTSPPTSPLPNPSSTLTSRKPPPSPSSGTSPSPLSTASSSQPSRSTKTLSSSTRLRIQQYLLLYNLISAILWFAVLARVLLLVPLVGVKNVYNGVGEFARWVQTLAVLEVGHAAFGLIRSPLPTTLIQVSSRLLLVHLIVATFPASTAHSPFYSTMLLAWSITEVIRYGYFVQTIRGVDPGILTWLRYNTFYVLYPLGIGSEMMEIWNASVGEMKGWEVWAAWGVLGGYVPGSYIMYTHMMRQRRRQSKGKAPVRRNRVDSMQR